MASAVAHSPLVVWVAFLLVHLWLGWLNLYGPGLPLGDVSIVYRFWMEQGFGAGQWVGIETAWVYPIVALVPLTAAAVFGFDLYSSTWLSMILLLDAIAFGVLTGWGRSRARIGAAWWWVAFLAVLGPIALARLDSVSVPLSIIAVLLIATRPRVATVVLTVAMWIKVWPAALAAAAVIALKQRLVVGVVALATSAVIIVGAVILGAGKNIFSFIFEQTGRSLQVESPIATLWLWRAFTGAPATFVYYDKQILTYQVHGPGVDAASALMNPLLAISVAVIVFFAVRSIRSGASGETLFPPLSLALVVALIAFNKVGSPQYIAWIAVPVVLGLATHAAGVGASFRVPALMTLLMAVLTQFIYPYNYSSLLGLDPLVLTALTVRNLLEFALLGWAVIAIRATRPAGPVDRDGNPVRDRGADLELAG